jgi:hypothetical protein
MWNTGSAGKCRRKFRRKFHAERVPSRQAIHNLVNKLKPTGLLIDKKENHKRRVYTEENSDDIIARLEHHLENHWNVWLKRLECQSRVQDQQHNFWSLDPIKQQNPRTPCSREIQLAGFIFAVGFCSLSSKVSSICSWHSFLTERGFTCRHTYIRKIISTGVHIIHI